MATTPLSVSPFSGNVSFPSDSPLIGGPSPYLDYTYSPDISRIMSNSPFPSNLNMINQTDSNLR